MQNVDNHMDDLFRKAADNYPLKTSNGDWDRLQVFLENEQSNPQTNVSKRKTFFFFAAFGFLLIGLMNAVVLKNKEVPKTAFTINNSTPALTGKTLIKSPKKPGNPAVASKKYELNDRQQKSSANARQPESKTVHSILAHPRTLANQPLVANSTIIAKAKTEVASKITKSNESKPFRESDLIPIKGLDTAIVKIDLSHIADTFFRENEKPVDYNLTQKSKAKMYFSVSAGVEYGQVKRQGFTRPGLNAGLFAGLQFNNRVSIEAGLQLSQKKYFTSGLYFKPKSGSMPSDMVVTGLSGNSILIELPLNLKYNFQKTDNTFYITAGISSFIMTRESNHYFAVISGTPTEFDGMYHHMHSYLASMINISGSYQFALNKKNNLRVEPYLQLPLRGMGIGSMPIMATGLHFVWSRY